MGKTPGQVYRTSLCVRAALRPLGSPFDALSRTVTAAADMSNEIVSECRSNQDSSISPSKKIAANPPLPLNKLPTGSRPRLVSATQNHVSQRLSCNKPDKSNRISLALVGGPSTRFTATWASCSASNVDSETGTSARSLLCCCGASQMHK